MRLRLKQQRLLELLAASSLSQNQCGQPHAREPLLFETSAREPLAYAIAGTALMFLALVSSLLPGMRAARTDPLVALRG